MMLKSYPDALWLFVVIMTVVLANTAVLMAWAAPRLESKGGRSSRALLNLIGVVLPIFGVFSQDHVTVWTLTGLGALMVPATLYLDSLRDFAYGFPSAVAGVIGLLLFSLGVYLFL